MALGEVNPTERQPLTCRSYSPESEEAVVPAAQSLY